MRGWICLLSLPLLASVHGCNSMPVKNAVTYQPSVQIKNWAMACDALASAQGFVVNARREGKITDEKWVIIKEVSHDVSPLCEGSPTDADAGRAVDAILVGLAKINAEGGK
ncbi:MAG: hypothetical protein ACYDAO_09435 [Thermoplasmataceae archaeon]